MSVRPRENRNYVNNMYIIVRSSILWAMVKVKYFDRAA